MSEPFGTALLVIGAAELLADREVDARVAKARKAEPEAELADVMAASLDAGELAALVGGSLFSPHSIVTLRGIDAATPEVQESLLAIAAQPPAELCLTMTHPGGVKAKSLVDGLKKAKVVVVQATEPKAWELPKFVAQEGRARGIRVDEHTARALIDAVGTDLRALAGAISQLASDVDGEALTPDVIQRYFAGRAEVSGFQVVDDVLNGNPGDALVKLRWTLATGTTPVMLTAAFAKSLRGLGTYLEMRSAQLSEAELARVCGVAPWKLKDLARQSRFWNSQAISSAIQAVARADAGVKGAVTDPGYALERMIFEMSQARQK